MIAITSFMTGPTYTCTIVVDTATCTTTTTDSMPIDVPTGEVDCVAMIVAPSHVHQVWVPHVLVVK